MHDDDETQIPRFHGLGLPECLGTVGRPFFSSLLWSAVLVEEEYVLVCCVGVGSR